MRQVVPFPQQTITGNYYSYGFIYNSKCRFSTAMGRSTTASGNNSTDGVYTEASGFNSTAMGKATVAIGDTIGQYTTASDGSVGSI